MFLISLTLSLGNRRQIFERLPEVYPREKTSKITTISPQKYNYKFSATSLGPVAKCDFIHKICS